MKKKITLEIEKNLVQDSQNLTKNQVASKYGISRTLVNRIYKKNNVEVPIEVKRKNYLQIDTEYFKEIDSHEKAYWLGYLAGDASIKENDSKVVLSSKDLEVVEKFKTVVKSDHKIGYRSYYDKRPNKLKTYTINVISITNKEFVSHIVKQGVNSSKSYDYIFPNIKKEYYYSFIAGLIDSDGSVTHATSKHSTKSLRLHISSSKECLFFIQKLFYDDLKVSLTKIQKVKSKSMNVYDLSLTRTSALEVLNKVYENVSNICLTRKYKLYKEWKNIME
jgi:hypothetical protein